MQLLVPTKIQSQLVQALTAAQSKEIGGIMMGEHLGPDLFRLEEITVQTHSGTLATFVRAVLGVMKPLRRFFDRTDRNYERFNYLGEWHSHPSFVPTPSPQDHRTMTEMVHDERLGANFLALFIVKLGPDGRLESSVTVYRAELPPMSGLVILQ
jgi:proteasome lid subunit RPN8/RPN11